MPLSERTKNASRTAVISSLISIALVAVLGFALYFERGGNSIVSIVEAPRSLVFEGSERQQVEITLKITNKSDEPFALEAENRCAILRWFVLDGGGNFIEARRLPKPCPSGEDPVSAILPPGNEINESVAINLSPELYGEGLVYVLHVKYWGIDGLHRFRIRKAE